MKEKQRAANNWVRVNDMIPVKMAIFKKYEKSQFSSPPFGLGQQSDPQVIKRRGKIIAGKYCTVQYSAKWS